MVAAFRQSEDVDPVTPSDPRRLLTARVMEEAVRAFGDQLVREEIHARVKIIVDQYYSSGEVKIVAFLPLLIMRDLSDTLKVDAEADHRGAESAHVRKLPGRSIARTSVVPTGATRHAESQTDLHRKTAEHPQDER